MRTRTTNRIVAGAAVALLIALSVILGLLTPNRQADLRKRPSSFFTDPTGARALLRVLETLLPEVGTWRRPLTTLPGLDATNRPATLLVAGPSRPLTPGETERLIAWIEAGGQLLLFTDDGWPIEQSRTNQPPPAARADAAPPRPTGGDARGPGRGRSIGEDTLVARLGTRFSLEPHREPFEVDLPRINPANAVAPPVRVRTLAAPAWSGTFEPLAADAEPVVAIEIRRRAGRAIVIADPAFVSNETLRMADNAVWLVDACVSRPGPVYIDEYHHGFGELRSQTELAWAFFRTPWGWCALQLIAAGGLYVLGCRRRMGRPLDPPAPGLRGATDAVAARAGLFQAARSRSLAADLIVQELCRQSEGRPGPPADLRAFCRQQRAGHQTAATAALYAELERLCERTRQDQPDAERSLIELGRVASRIEHLQTKSRHEP
jgi:hypothetical protein